MAGSQKKKGKKPTRATKNKKKKKTLSEAEKKEMAGFHREVTFIGVTGLSLLLFIGNFGLAGKAGDFSKALLFGLFGLLAYIFPILLFLGIAGSIANPGDRRVKRKILAGMLIYVALSAAIELITYGYRKHRDFLDIYRTARIRMDGGGLFGAGIIKVLYPLLGKAGTLIVLMAALILGIVFITEKSALKGSKKACVSVRDFFERKVTEYGKKKDFAREIRMAEKEKTKKKKSLPKMPGLKKTAPEDAPKKAEGISFESTVLESDFPELKTPEDIPINRAGAPENTEDVPGERKKKKRDPEAAKAGAEEIEAALKDSHGEDMKNYVSPDVSLLKPADRTRGASNESLRSTAELLTETLESFGVHVTVTNISCGPSVTRYELQPEQGVKVSRIVNLSDDIKLNLAAPDIRIEAPIPGKAAVGIEVPNKVNQAVMLREILESQEFRNHKSKIAFAVGKDIGGKPVVTDIKKMPHLLIAGATGSGKSVCINSLIMSILYKARPDEVKLIMIDPKVVELSVYNGIPHLMIPVVTDPRKASGALNWAVMEMTKRYEAFAEHQVRDIEGYNARIRKGDIKDALGEVITEKMPQIVIVVDELADLMMVASSEVEESICRLAQLARAAGIHLVLATQRPSVNVITGLIKANMPSRIAFSVSSGVDSRTIIDMNGAEKLLGKGDMLFYPQSYQQPVRVQGTFVTDAEVQKVVDFLIEQNGKASYSSTIKEQIENVSGGGAGGALPADEKDEYFRDAAEFVAGRDTVSIGSLQRAFKVGFNRAARIMEQLSDEGIVGESEDKKPRKVLMNKEALKQYFENAES